MFLYYLVACSGKITALLILDKPISKKACAKGMLYSKKNKNLREIYKKKTALEAKTYLKNTSSITVDPLADTKMQNIEIAVNIDGSWGSHGWTSQNGTVDVWIEETGKVLDIILKSALCHQCS